MYLVYWSSGYMFAVDNEHLERLLKEKEAKGIKCCWKIFD